MKHRDRLVRFTLSLLLPLLIGTLCACGKEGPPVPRDQRNMFAWGETDADFAGDCLLFTGQLQGAYENASIFGLELETTTAEICLDCPFKPEEFLEITPSGMQDGLVILQHCPSTRADAYRWRLIAHNVFQSLPHALSPVKLVRRPF